MTTDRRIAVVKWLGPAFLLVLVAGFVVGPWSLMDKLYGVCFGI